MKRYLIISSNITYFKFWFLKKKKKLFYCSKMFSSAFKWFLKIIFLLTLLWYILYYIKYQVYFCNLYAKNNFLFYNNLINFFLNNCFIESMLLIIKTEVCNSDLFDYLDPERDGNLKTDFRIVDQVFCYSLKICNTFLTLKNI